MIVAPLQLLLSLYLLLVGHNAPGGGFVGGLIGGAALILYMLGAGDSGRWTKMLRMAWFWFVRGGILLTVMSGVPALLVGEPFLAGLWWGDVYFPIVGVVKFGTIFLFDLGVYLLVVGFSTGLVVCFSRTGSYA